MQQQSRIFEIGVSTKNPGRGRGLAIVRESIELQEAGYSSKANRERSRISILDHLTGDRRDTARRSRAREQRRQLIHRSNSCRTSSLASVAADFTVVSTALSLLRSFTVAPLHAARSLAILMRVARSGRIATHPNHPARKLAMPRLRCPCPSRRRSYRDRILQRPDRQSGRPDARSGGVLPKDESGRPLNLDFEKGTLEDWTATGTAFARQPVEGDAVHARRSDMRSGHAGRYWVGSFERGGDPHQPARSPHGRSESRIRSPASSSALDIIPIRGSSWSRSQTASRSSAPRASRYPAPADPRKCRASSSIWRRCAAR